MPGGPTRRATPPDIQVITDPVDLSEMADEWDDLVRRAECPDVFLSWGFCWAWWQAFGDGCHLRVVVLRDPSGRLRLLAPLYSHPASPGVMRVLGYPRADYNNLVVSLDDKHALDDFFRWLRRRRDCRALLLRRVPAEASVLHHFRPAFDPGRSLTKNLAASAARPLPFVVRRWRREHPRIRRADLEKLAGLLTESATYRRPIRKLQERGRLQYERISNSDEIRELLPEFMDLHISQFSRKGILSGFNDVGNRNFYRLLTQELRSTNILRLDILRLEGVTLAAHFGFTWGSRVFYYKPAYNPEFSACRPGKLLLAHIIRDCYEQGADELDLLFGNEPYKERYASDVRLTASLQIWSSAFQAVRERLAQRHPDTALAAHASSGQSVVDNTETT